MNFVSFSIGTAAWSIPLSSADAFPGSGSQLERYSRRLRAVEVNSSFYRDHKPETYQRWASCVPPDFRFSVKLSKVFTHQRRLRVEAVELERVLAGIQRLGPKLGVLLVQLPPSLGFEAPRAEAFFRHVRGLFAGPVALEPRHPSWTEDTAADLLRFYDIGRVWADPEPCPLPTRPWPALRSLDTIYFRLHGSPTIYKSEYDARALALWTERLRRAAAEAAHVWCVFDNTALGHATQNALQMSEMLGDGDRSAGEPCTARHDRRGARWIIGGAPSRE